VRVSFSVVVTVAKPFVMWREVKFIDFGFERLITF